MAVSITNITSGNQDTSGSSASTSSITPVANKLYLLTVACRTNLSIDSNTPSVSGCGLTWSIVTDGTNTGNVLFDTTSASRKRQVLFRALGSTPSTGSLTIDYGGQTQTGIVWTLEELDGIDTSSPIVQVATNRDTTATASTITATLAAFSSTNNATFGSMAADGNPTKTPNVGTGFSQIGTANNSGDGVVVCSEFRSDNDTTVDISWSGGVVDMGAIALEIKAAGSVAAQPRQQLLSLLGLG